MQDCLLSTKMQPPQTHPGLVSRPRLKDALGDVTGARLTLISAPAGFGKTTLVAHWAGAETACAWLTLDPGDNDPARFFSYLYAVLHGATPEFDPQALPIPPAMEPAHIEPIAIAIINQLAVFRDRLNLILDDYHCVGNEDLHGFIGYLVEHLPAHVRIYLITRTDPPLPLSRWRGLGHLQELRAADLRFTREEGRRYLDQVVKAALTERDLEVIEAKSEGWITGLQLAALSLNRQQDPRRFVQSFSGSNEYIADYLTDEVISGQPADIQSFLLQTSILEHLSGDLCDAVTGQSGGQAILEQLAHGNLFVTPLGTDQSWYRYHQLFADLLRKRLQLRHPELVPELYGRASRWHEEKMLIDDAIRYATTLGDQDRVLMLIESHILDRVLQGQLHLVDAWLHQLSEERSWERPVLCVAQAWISIRSLATARANTFIDRTEELISGDRRSDHASSAVIVDRHIATLKAAVARTEGRSPSEQQQLIRKALEVVPRSDTALWGMLILRLGLCLLDLGDDQSADRAFRDVIAAGDPAQATSSVYSAVYARTVVAHLQGRLRDIEELCSRTLSSTARMAGAPWQRVAAHAFAHTALGLVELEWNHLDGAAYHLQRGLSLNATSGVTELRIKGQYAIGRLAVAQGKPPRSIDLVGLHDGALPELLDFAQVLQTHLWLLAARTSDNGASALGLAIQWAEKQSLSPAEGRDRDWQIKRQLVLVRVVLSLAGTRNGAPGLPSLAATVPILDDMVATFSDAGWGDRVIEILIVRAQVLDALDRQEAALASLGIALELAEPQGYARSFLDEGRPIAKLLHERVRRDPEASTYAAELLTQVSHRTTAFLAKDGQERTLIRPLTPREIEVLALIAEGLSNLEIGQRLSIALGTVKRHTANINNKLDTRSRTQAVAVARSLGILS